MIEFDASKVVIDVNGREVIEFGGTRPTTPTDTEMLDWLQITGAETVQDSNDSFTVVWYNARGTLVSECKETLRRAIAAAMAKEAK